MNERRCASAPDCPPLTHALTVTASFVSDDSKLEVFQSLVSQWAAPDGFAGFAAFDAGNTDGLDSTGYFGAVFDGRYVYFVPEIHGDLNTHATVLRFDTHGSFTDKQAWSAYDAAATAGLDTRGFYGAAFDGRYVNFVPRQINRDYYHSRLLRLDTQGDFKDPASWDASDLGEAHSQQSGAFDGRYLYFAPGFDGDPMKEDQYCGRVIRVDTRCDIHDAASHTSIDIGTFLGNEARCFDGAAFDGRYVYLVPLYTGVVARYDTTAPFDAPDSWSSIDLKPLGCKLAVGAVFDGTHLYLCAYDHGRIIRFDSRYAFEGLSSWETYDADETQGIRTVGFDGGFFDGRFVWFQPFFYHAGPGKRDNHFHSHYLRYDMTKPFHDAGSWQAYDATTTDGLRSFGYNAGTFDGRYFYAAPWQQGPDTTGEKRCIVHGNVLRVDTLGAGGGAFSLRYCDYGHNGGLNAAAPGPTFVINTDDGRALSVIAHVAPPEGRHHMAGVYDGQSLALYVDGREVARRAASGRLAASAHPITVGQLPAGGGRFHGRIDAVTVRNIAVSAADLSAEAEVYLTHAKDERQ